MEDPQKPKPQHPSVSFQDDFYHYLDLTRKKQTAKMMGWLNSGLLTFGIWFFIISAVIILILYVYVWLADPVIGAAWAENVFRLDHDLAFAAEAASQGMVLRILFIVAILFFLIALLFKGLQVAYEHYLNWQVFTKDAFESLSKKLKDQ